MKTVTGNLLYAKEQYVAHQCNCTSRGVTGVAASIFRQWPTANVYDLRYCPKLERRVGNVWVCRENNRPVIAMFAQHYPGGPSSMTVPGTKFVDDDKQRLTWFKTCLKKIAELKPESVAFPHSIGCGLAKGNWNEYLATLVTANSWFNVVLYKKLQ